MKYCLLLLIFFTFACDPLLKEYHKNSAISNIEDICAEDSISCGQIRYALAKKDMNNESSEGILYKDLKIQGEQLIAQEGAKIEQTKKRIQLLNSAATVKVYQFWIEEQSYRKQQAISFSIKNTCTSEIKAIKGQLIVKDLFGDVIRIFDVKMDVNLPQYGIENGGTVVSQYYDYNPYIPEHIRIGDKSPNEFELTWIPIKIVLDGGYTLE